MATLVFYFKPAWREGIIFFVQGYDQRSEYRPTRSVTKGHNLGDLVLLWFFPNYIFSMCNSGGHTSFKSETYVVISC